MSLSFEARPQGIFLNGNRLNLFGVNWFGAEISGCPHGLWSVSWKSVLDGFMTKHGVNMIRLPMSVEMALDMDVRVPEHINYSVNPDLQGLTAGKVLDKIMDGCRERGILVMPVFHRLKSGEEIPELWYREPDFPESKVIKAWLNVVQRYRNNPYMFAVDLKNEAHGRATWHVGDPATDWADACERMGNAILKENPKLLVVVEGIDRSSDASTKGLGAYWGEMLDGVRAYPVKLCVPNRVVYSPHTYGPDVFFMQFYKDASFPANMPDIWTKKFQYICRDNLGCVLIGELGGRYEAGSLDEKWHEAFASFVANDPALCGSICIWAYNANSGNDTKGLVKDDWTTVDTRKMELYRKMCPSPTSILTLLSSPVPAKPVVAVATKPPVVKPAVSVTNATNVTSTSTATWVEGGVEFTRYDLCVKNTTRDAWRSLRVEVKFVDRAKQNIKQSWGCAAIPPNTNIVGLPDWMSSLEPGKEWTFGMIVQGTNFGKPSFSLVQKK